MSEFHISEQTRAARQMFGAYCVPCQEMAVVVALAEIRDTSPARAFDLMSLALGILEDGVVKPCQDVCANSAGWLQYQHAIINDEPEQHKYQADNYADWSEEICSRCGDMRYAHKK